MIGALWTGISGLSSQQKALDNESNNIANVNTVGYKSSRISFADQMYQSKIGKGSIVQDAEKLFVQGNTKITGVEYDMMLEGDGFFTVINKNTLGTAESFYTRAGNFRMGDNGTLQDAGGNEVQGWIMQPIDAQNDVTSTNPNTSVFTNEYNKMLGSKIIRHGTYVETITAKATDYSTTAKADSTTVFSGDGAKSKSSKVSDVEEAIKDYTAWLQKLQENPDAPSSNSIAQVSQIDFKSGTESIIGKDGDRVKVVIDGQTISQNFKVTSASEEFMEELYNNLSAQELSDYGLVDPSNPSTLTPAEKAAYDKAAGKIETYKALADLISNRLPVEATMAIDSAELGNFNINESFKNSTKLKDMMKGIIQIKSLIPGQEFKITEISEQSGERIVQGNYQSTSLASKGSGIAAVNTAKDALSRLITGKQQDVYTPIDLGLSDGIPKNFTYSITIYDKEKGMNIPIPNDGGNPPVAVDVEAANITNIDDAVSQLNSNAELSNYIEARNVNGNLVIQTKNDNYDVEFSSNLKKLPTFGVSLNSIVDQATYDFSVDVDGTPFSFSYTPAGSTTTTPNDIYVKVRDEINNYNLTAQNKLELSSLVDGNFSIYSKNPNIELDNSNISINGEVIPAMPIPVPNTAPTTIMASGIFNINIPTPTTPPTTTTYSIDVLGQAISFSSLNPTNESVYNGLVNAIRANTAISDLVDVGTLGGSSFSITQKKVNQTTPNVTISGGAGIGYSGNTTELGDPKEYTFTPTLADTNSASMLTFTLDGVDLKVQTDQTPTVSEIGSALAAELAKNKSLSDKYTISVTGGDIAVTEKISPTGYMGFTAPSMIFSSLITNGLTAKHSTNNSKQVEINKDYSGREGAGAEFLEIKTTVDQTASKGSIQLRLDTLDISDSPFGEFSVDSTGLITMKQDGAEFAIGQVAIARFNNNRGLEPQGNNLFAKTTESGDPIYNINNNKMADVRGKALELSNADLSESLVNLMIFQRAFEANAKSITTSDELLNTLINLKR